jgi:transposase
MDQIHVVRHKVLVEGVSIRKVAKEMGLARNTVRRYLADTPPVGREPTERRHPVSDAVRPRLHALLGEAPRWTGGKQRLTSMRLHEMLVAEGLLISARMVRREVAEWKRQRQEVFVPLVYQPGDLAEVDFFEVLVDVGGQRRKAWMFLLRLMYSGRDFAWLYPRQDQVCFLDAHVRAFAHLGAVPHRLAYDNLKPAVTRVLVGAERELARRFLALATHYVLEPSFARPRTGHDKGGVEARGKGVRWQHLVPIPSGPDLETISRRLMEHLDGAAEQRRGSDGRTVAELFAEELPAMLPLPGRPFRAAAADTASVSRRALVKVAGASYSVWCDWAGLGVTTYLGVDEVELVGRDGRRVQHPRQAAGGRSVDYRHYLPELARKPQAIRQVAGELVRDLGSPFRELWRELVDEDGPRYASRIFAKVLEAVVELGRPTVVQRLLAGRADGVPVLLALRPPSPPPRDLAASVVPIALQDIEVIANGVQHYDALLGDAA